MVGTIELDAIKQGYEISIRQLRTMLSARAHLQEAAEQTAVEIEEELKRIAEALCPGLVDDARKEGPAGLEIFEASELVSDIIRDVQRRLSRLNAAEATGRSVTEMYDNMLEENIRLREDNERLNRELNETRARVERMESRMAVLQQSLESAQRRLGDASAPVLQQQTGSFSPDRLPEWMQEWKQKSTYERDIALLQVLAETGAPRRLDVAKMFAAQLDIKATGGGVARAFRRTARQGLIELIEGQSGASGASGQLICLTEQGRDACRLLLGQEPVPSQASELLSRHKSAAHTLLNLEAADLLRDAGYEVDLFPGQVKLPDERLFVPDLAASLEGQTLFVEVELQAYKNAEERNRKWRNYYDATNGEFYIVVADKSAMDALRSEILFWAGRQRLVLWMIDVSDMKGKRKQGDDVWSYKRGEK